MTVSTDTTRRALLGGAGLLASAVVIGATATAAEPHADLERLFAAWQASITRINDLNISLTPAEDEALWAVVDNAEEAIRASAAKSPRIAEMRLWIALQHMTTSYADSAACCSENLAALLANEVERDWEQRVAISALRALVREA